MLYREPRIHEGERDDARSIGVVIPVYNGEKYLIPCIDSIFTQAYLPKEVVIVNDGSTDRTADVIAAVKQKYPIVQSVDQPNAGQAAARNAGACRLTTAYIAFCDVDDTWYPEKLEKQIALLHEKNCDFVFANADIVNGRGKHYGTQFSIVRPARGSIYRKLLFGNFVNTTTVVMKAPFFNSLGGFDTSSKHRFVEDYDLWLRAARKGTADYIEEPLVTYLRYDESSSHFTVRSAKAAWRLLASQPAKGVAEKVMKVLALVRQTAVTGMYATRLDRMVSPLSKAG